LLLAVALYFVPGVRLLNGIVSVFSKETSTVSIPGLEVEYDSEAAVSSILSTVTFCGGGTKTRKKRASLDKVILLQTFRISFSARLCYTFYLCPLPF